MLMNLSKPLKRLKKLEKNQKDLKWKLNRLMGNSFHIG